MIKRPQVTYFPLITMYLLHICLEDLQIQLFHNQIPHCYSLEDLPRLASFMLKKSDAVYINTVRKSLLAFLHISRVCL